MESAAEPSNSSLREWLYIDSSGLQKGPVPANVLERLLEKGVGISANTLVWKAGMTTWLPLAQVCYCTTTVFAIWCCSIRHIVIVLLQ